MSANRTAIVVDSNAQLPDELRQRLEIEVVPIVIIINGVDHHETDLDADDFYEQLAAGAEVSTSQPAPGELLEVYERLAVNGVTDIVSIHVGSSLSGTANSATLAAELATARVHVVDTQQTSFSVGLCAWAAADALHAGGSPAEVIAAAEAALPTIANVFVVSALDLARDSGRITVSQSETDDVVDAIPVVALRGTDLDVVGNARSVAEACDQMAAVVADELGRLRVGIGVGGSSAFEFYDALEQRLDALPNVAEIVRYRCGPSVGAFSGPGVAGIAWAPIA